MTSKSRWVASVLVLLNCVGAVYADTALIAAVKEQDNAKIRSLIAENADVNAPQPDGATALHWAVHRNDLGTARLLIEAGADVNAANDFGVLPIFLAATNCNASIVELLLDAEANPNAALLTGESILMSAAHAGDLDVVNVLIRHGADVDAKEPARKQTALMWALDEGHTDVARSLIQHGADIHAKTSLRFTPLMFAARVGDVESAELLLNAGAAVDEKALMMGRRGGPSQDENGMGALHVATVRGHTEMVKLLLSSDADPNYDGPGYTPLHWACGTWETELNGANGISAPKGHEWDTLRGVQEGKFEMVRALLDHGADPNARLKKGPKRYGFTSTSPSANSTPLTLAAYAGEAEIMKLLVEYGADISLKSDNGFGPLLTASGVNRWMAEFTVEEEDVLAAVKFAVECGEDVNQADEIGGNTAMHGAAWIRSTKLVRFLAGQGADVNAMNDLGITPFQIAEHRDRRGDPGTGLKVSERLPVGHLLLELSVPEAVKTALDEWSNLPRHVRVAVEILLKGELDRD